MFALEVMQASLHQTLLKKIFAMLAKNDKNKCMEEQGTLKHNDVSGVEAEPCQSQESADRQNQQDSSSG